MKLPEEAEILASEDRKVTLTYVFKEITAPEGYAIIADDLTLEIDFSINPSTNEIYIADARSSDENYLRIKTEIPCTTDTRLEVDILNNVSNTKEYTIHYEPNNNNEGNF